MIDEDLIRAHRERAMDPDRPVLRGSAQNPDVFFQAREASNPFYLAVPGIVQETMDRFAELTGRSYRLFEYVGAADAERVLVMMGSGVGAAEEAVERLMRARRKGRPVQGAALSAVRHGGVCRCLAEHDPRDRGARPHEGTGRDRRAAVSGRGHGTCTNSGSGRKPDSQALPQRDRRAVWLVVEGVHAGDGGAGTRGADLQRAEAALHRRHPRRRDAAEPRLGSGLLHRSRTTSRGPCSTAWAATARSARARTR